jgi:hypothetical protein
MELTAQVNEILIDSHLHEFISAFDEWKRSLVGTGLSAPLVDLQ